MGRQMRERAIRFCVWLSFILMVSACTLWWRSCEAMDRIILHVPSTTPCEFVLFSAAGRLHSYLRFESESSYLGIQFKREPWFRIRSESHGGRLVGNQENLGEPNLTLWRQIFRITFVHRSWLDSTRHEATPTLSGGSTWGLIVPYNLVVPVFAICPFAWAVLATRRRTARRARGFPIGSA
jgi:hypothetical protein